MRERYGGTDTGTEGESRGARYSIEVAEYVSEDKFCSWGGRLRRRCDVGDGGCAVRVVDRAACGERLVDARRLQG